ncbi:MAG: hypothetical protein L6V85_07785 [Clostridiales bacterium]|nr:MAG: hypothetical protein L6V85_07785 [Clostridiales bacterium]
MSKDKKQKDVKDEKVETEVPETENAETEPVEEVKETELETARREASEYKDLALRRMAELENFRRNNQNLAKDVRDRTLSEVIFANPSRNRFIQPRRRNGVGRKNEKRHRHCERSAYERP